MQYFTLVLAKETGWSEETIVNMPYHRVKQYLHCLQVYNGVATKWIYTDENKKENLKQLIRNKLNDYNKNTYNSNS